MQLKLTYVVAALAAIASATPTSLSVRGQGGQCEPSSSCTTGPIKCCESLSTGTSSVTGLVLALLGIVLSDPNVNVGLTCNTLGVGSSCNGQVVCCEDNSHSLISVGCIPIQL